MRVRVRLRFELRDAWIGLWWNRDLNGLRVVVCPLPFLAIDVRVAPRLVWISEPDTRPRHADLAGMSPRPLTPPQAGGVQAASVEEAASAGDREAIHALLRGRALTPLERAILWGEAHPPKGLSGHAFPTCPDCGGDLDDGEPCGRKPPKGLLNG